MLGPFGEDNILGAPGTGAVLINVDYTIEGTGTIGGGDGNLTFENFGTVNANNGLLTINTGNQVYNDGLMEASVDPLAATTGTLAIKDSVVNAGTVQADGAGRPSRFPARRSTISIRSSPKMAAPSPSPTSPSPTRPSARPTRPAARSMRPAAPSPSTAVRSPTATCWRPPTAALCSSRISRSPIRAPVRRAWTRPRRSIL